MNMW